MSMTVDVLFILLGVAGLFIYTGFKIENKDRENPNPFSAGIKQLFIYFGLLTLMFTVFMAVGAKENIRSNVYDENGTLIGFEERNTTLNPATADAIAGYGELYTYVIWFLFFLLIITILINIVTTLQNYFKKKRGEGLF